uniref:Uncharacterized protein n=1 Tax=Janibacter limosus TaxID=53458 RepID=A0AC61U6J0_9MICO|nr:hypothetical protein [Janibacter limosus]
MGRAPSGLGELGELCTLTDPRGGRQGISPPGLADDGAGRHGTAQRTLRGSREELGASGDPTELDQNLLRLHVSILAGACAARSESSTGT